MPDFGLEDSLRSQGFARIAGVDEAGRGPLAGPVVAAAVVLPREWRTEVLLDDSKRLTSEQREASFGAIQRLALGWSVAVVSSAEVDRLNVLQAALQAMAEAVAGLDPGPEFVLVDGNRLPNWNRPARAVVKGDGLSLSIAAASIVAKVVRDRIMRDFGRRYPEWEFDRHKGYGTPRHLEALRRHGPSPIHRLTFRPLRAP